MKLTDCIYRTDFVITTSVDGHLKLWKKQESGIEFVKHYRAHLTPVVAVSASADGQLFASVSEDGSAKVFDVVNFGRSSSAHWSSWSPYFSRYDQHNQAWIYTSCVLLGSSARPSPRSSSSVCVLRILCHPMSHIYPGQTQHLGR